ncbi:efflux RND transporter periplasmic adaptor subunit [Terrimonas pollutisoli]|uniref:efflux RND transporter periplasmic adaptor subunit n=1 Tax=Terrimonas pollutisoli TaxID=3034147 RepID=UPI0023EBCA0C|nr:efflux RND transporter periplasmic adaptor subunit [Terrimonas sp. H1YJ31]
MNKTLKWILIIVATLVVVAVIWTLIAGKNSGAVKVAVEKVTKRTIIETVTASGNIYPEVEVKISPDISGEITELNVQEGDSVKKGQVLARIFADIYALQRDEAASQVGQSEATVSNSQAALDATKASLDQAKQAYERNKSLFEQKVISQSEFEQFETTYRSAQANYNAALQNIKGLQANVRTAETGLTKANKDLGRTTLVAPMNGVISSLKVKKGERVAGNSFNVGTEMMTVADMSVMEVRVDVGENDIVKVNIGDSADVELDAYNNRKFKGVVTQIASSTKTTAASAVSNEVTNYEVRIRLDRGSYKDLIDPSKPKRFPFRPGMNANADIKTKRIDNVLAAPITAVNARVKGSDKSIADKKKENEANKEEDNLNMTETAISDELEEVVFVLQKDGTVKKTVVKSGIQDINYIEIRSGLSGGEDVVVGPYNAISKTLKDGMKVTVVPKDKLFEKK